MQKTSQQTFVVVDFYVIKKLKKLGKMMINCMFAEDFYWPVFSSSQKAQQ